MFYVFMTIKNDRAVLQSKALEVCSRADLKVISWVVMLLKAAVMPSPCTSPTKPGPQRGREFRLYVLVGRFSG